MKHKITKIGFGSIAAVIAAVAFTVSVQAAVVLIATPSAPAGWSTADTRPGGAVNYVADVTSPYGDAALQLTTDATNAAKAQYLHETNTPIAEVTTLGYETKQVSGPAYAAASYQLVVLLNGTTTGYTTFVFEPYENGTVTNGNWQSWDVDAGQFWSSRSFTDGTCSVTAGAGGAPYYTLAGIQAMCPNAVAVAFGVNIGSYNPSYDVYTDGVVFNGTTYDFELVAPDTTAPAAPTPVSPANNSTTTTLALTQVDWTDVTDPSAPVTYLYEVSNSPATDPDGSFTSPIYASGVLTDSNIPTPGTPQGTYYWHVTATDGAGNVSSWSTTWSFVVDNTPVVPPVTGPVTKDDCKNNGWKSFTNPSFKNQGACVSSVANGK